MDQVELSVIIPVFNTEKYFKRCIESVINSIKKVNIKSEIIVINDGSTGNINEIIEEYISKYENQIRYVSQLNRGRGASRNVGILESKGKYISFVDSDDYIDENMYIKMFSKILDEKSDIVICDFENIDYDNPKENFRLEAKNVNIKDNKWGCFDVLIMPSCCNKIIKKELFSGISFPEHINYEDLATIPLLLLKAKHISYINEMLYKYVQNKNSVMHEKFNLNQLNLIDALDIIFDRIDGLSEPIDVKEKAQYMLFTRRYYENLLENIMNCENKEILIEKFCDKIKILQKKMYKNYYFKKQISSQGFIKKIGNRLLYKAIQNNNYKLLEHYLKKSIYYKFFAIRYTSIDC